MNLFADTATETNEHFVSDGFRTFSYAELRNACAWDAWLEQSCVSRRECLALETRTDARSAAALLGLLGCGQSVLLWRQPIAIEHDRVAAGVLPRFCRAALVESGDHGLGPEAASGLHGWRLVQCGTESRRLTDIGGPYVYLPTSGTTGKPKIVVYEPNALLDNARNCVSRFRLGPADRVMIPVPLAHMYGLGAALLPAVLAGACVRLIPDANLVNYVQAETEFGPTTTFLTPGFCHLLVKGRKQPRPYRLTVLAGDAADVRTFAAYEQRHGCTVSLYGSTELGAISAGSPDESFPERRDSAGTPMPGVRLAMSGGRNVSDREARQPFPLRFEHPYGCAGYAGGNGKPVKPPSLYRSGCYCTRDMGRVDAGGRLQLAGRFDDTVKRAGFLVALADVERALRQRADIESVVVVPGGMTPRGRELVAFCKVAPEAPTDSAMLRRFALEHLPRHAVPDRFILLQELPLTATAKPDRRALAALASHAKECVPDADSE